jgi:xanthosine utilization system XapX-like protein
MIARRIGWVVAAVTLAASATYVFVYLYRWEWNRALMSSALFIVAEVGLVGMLLARRLTKIEHRLDQSVASGRHQTVQHLRASAPPPRVRFEWLSRPDQMNVFVPVLLGAGVVLSGLAWLVERLARLTARPLAEHALAARLDDLQLPAKGFLDDAADPFALLRGPVGGAP